MDFLRGGSSQRNYANSDKDQRQEREHKANPPANARHLLRSSTRLVSRRRRAGEARPRAARNRSHPCGTSGSPTISTASKLDSPLSVLPSANPPPMQLCVALNLPKLPSGPGPHASRSRCGEKTGPVPGSSVLASCAHSVGLPSRNPQVSHIRKENDLPGYCLPSEVSHVFSFPPSGSWTDAIHTLVFASDPVSQSHQIHCWMCSRHPSVSPISCLHGWRVPSPAGSRLRPIRSMTDASAISVV